jgi:N6-L-threonylcarbamoyladenine synthase
MKILAIETSCDETAVALLEASGTDTSATFKILGNALISQIDIHKQYGGVFPALAKRAHAENLTPLLHAALKEAGMHTEAPQDISEETRTKVSEILAREPGLTSAFLSFLTQTSRADIDAIAVTHGPGLEPALWVGVNFANALSVAWDIPIVPINHMEGHFLAALGNNVDGIVEIKEVRLPVLGLLISGGHTELDLMKDWLSYQLMGATRDDAVGEAFDKVARMMDLPYPGGPEISKLAERDREASRENPFSLPRPMLDSDDYDFSFSGIKTSVLYKIKEKGTLTDIEKEQMAREFEDAVSEVLWKKASRALDESGAQMLIIGGGVSANKHIQRLFTDMIAKDHSGVTLHIPSRDLTTDNAVMIGIAGYYRALRKEFKTNVSANGNLHLAP